MKPNESSDEQLDHGDLIAIKNILKSVELDPWLMSGSMLGCVLYGTTLPNDRDIDLGLYASDRERFNRVIPNLKAQGFTVQGRFDPVTLQPKNMVSLKRYGRPYDIKFFRSKCGYSYREIHKSNSIPTMLIWEIIDTLYYGTPPPFGILWKKAKLLASLASASTQIIPSSIKKNIILRLAKIWRNGNSLYGVEILPSKIFEDFIVKDLCGVPMRLPSDWKSYLVQEYGENWNNHDPSNKGGWLKRSHIVSPKKDTSLVLSNMDTELRRRYIAAGYFSEESDQKSI